MTADDPIQPLKPLEWMGSTQKVIRELPVPVKQTFGFALHRAQSGEKGINVKPLKGFGGASTLEVIEDYASDTYRAVYTVRFAEAVYVLHVFKKKSKTGISTPKQDLDLIKQRLKNAERHYREHYG